MKRLLLLSILLLLLPVVGNAGGLAQEEDGSPSGYWPWFKFSNGTITDNGDGTLSIDNSGGAPSDVTTVDAADENATFYIVIVDGQTGSQAVETDGTGTADLAYNPSTNVLTVTGGITTGGTATPAVVLEDSDDAAGTGSINANSSGGANDIILSIGVEDSSGESTEYMQLDGVDEQVQFLKPTDFADENMTSIGTMTCDNVHPDAATLIIGQTDEEVRVRGDAAPDTDHRYNCFASVGGWNSGEDIDFGEVVYLDGTSNEWMLADASTGGSKWPAIGFAVACPGGGAITSEPCQDGEEIVICTVGNIRDDTWTWSDTGEILYVSETAGGLTETAPADSGDLVQALAVAIDDDNILFPLQSWYLQE